MIVDLETLDLDDRAGAVLSFAEVIESGAEVPFPRPVEGRITFSRGGGGVTWVRGEVGTAVTLTCARCARPFLHRLVGVFREGYRPGAGEAESKAGAEPGEWRGRGAVVLPLAAPHLDVTEVVRQHLVMAVPMAPLHRPDCRGLCPTCGADRNEEACACPVDEGDPRLRVLRGFRPASG
ncbi:MAG: YceD family protein [bacterium]